MAVLRFEPFRDPFDRLMSLATSGTRTPLGMPIDIYRSDDGSYHVETDLPGVDSASIEVTVEHSTLTIKADRAPRYGDSDQVIAAERPQGTFARQFALGEGVDAEHLTAGYSEGVLHVTIPAAPKTQARRISVTHTPVGRRTVSAGTEK
jgi:HSP20 family protein